MPPVQNSHIRFSGFNDMNKFWILPLPWKPLSFTQDWSVWAQNSRKRNSTNPNPPAKRRKILNFEEIPLPSPFPQTIISKAEPTNFPPAITLTFPPFAETAYSSLNNPFVSKTETSSVLPVYQKIPTIPKISRIPQKTPQIPFAKSEPVTLFGSYFRNFVSQQTFRFGKKICFLSN